MSVCVYDVCVCVYECVMSQCLVSPPTDGSVDVSAVAPSCVCVCVCVGVCVGRECGEHESVKAHTFFSCSGHRNNPLCCLACISCRISSTQLSVCGPRLWQDASVS